ncbi:unnamed protein product [Arabidopsis halleri]
MGNPVNSLLLSLLATSLMVDLKTNAMHYSRLGLPFISEKASTWVSWTAGELPLGPSEAPFPVKTSTALGDSFFRATFLPSKNKLISWISISAVYHASGLLSPKSRSPEMPKSLQIFSPSPASRRTLTLAWSTNTKLGFRLMGHVSIFGPITSSNLKPYIFKTRSVLSNFLLSPRPRIFRFIDSNGLTHQLSLTSISWRWMCDCHSPNLVRSNYLDYDTIHLSFRLFGSLLLVPSHVNGLKKIGIIIPAPWCSGYQNLSKPFFPFLLNTEFKQELFNIFKVIIHEISSLRKNGIMIPSPRSGDYRSFLNLSSSTPSDFRTITNFLLAEEQFQIALTAPTRTSEPFSTSLSLLTVTIVSSYASSVDDSSTNRVITCTNLLPSFGLQALMDPSSKYFSYLCVAFALTFVCPICNLIILVPLVTLNLVLL